MRELGSRIVGADEVNRPSDRDVEDVARFSRRSPSVVGRGIVALSRASYRKMNQALWWAAGYNVAAIPPAVGVLAAP